MEGKKAHQEMYDAGMRTGVIAILGFVFLCLLIMTGRSEHALGGGPFDQPAPIMRSVIPITSSTAVSHHSGMDDGSSAIVGQDDERYHDYVVRITNYENEGSFEILQNGRQVFSLRGASHFGFADIRDGSNYILLMGTDVTGNGQPDLVVSEWSLDARCRYTYHLFEIGDSFKRIQSIDAGSGESAHFRNLDGAPGLEFVTSDRTFAYEPADYADSPAPRVILKYDGASYVFAHELMRQAPPHPDRVSAMAEDIRAMERWHAGSPPEEIGQKMIDLIYSGNMPYARKLLDLAWPPDLGGKEDFLLSLTARLEESPFYTDLVSINR